MHISHNVKMLCFRVHTVIVARRKAKQRKRMFQISAPFDVRKERVTIPGISDNELDVMREQALASRVGVASASSAERGPPPRMELMFGPMVNIIPPSGAASLMSGTARTSTESYV